MAGDAELKLASDVDLPEEVIPLLNLSPAGIKERNEVLKNNTEVQRWRNEGSKKYPKITRARAIDVHEHPQSKPYGIRSQLWFQVPMEKYLIGKETTIEEVIKNQSTEDEWIESRFRRYNVRATPIAWDDETQRASKEGLGITSNDYIAWLCKKYPDVFPTGWACVDPHKGKLALLELERSIKELGLVGVKFQQAAQQFVPSEKQWYPLWDLCQDLGIPVQFHCGYTGVGGGPPGGTGVNPIHYTNPYWLDFICSDFPNLTVIGCHPAWPYEEIALAICLHKGNFFREISGQMPRYFDPHLVREMNTRMKHKYMFGAEVPVFQMDEIFRQHAELEYRPGVWSKVMYENTERVLGITREPAKDKPEWASQRNLKLKRWFDRSEEDYWKLEGVEFVD